MTSYFHSPAAKKQIETCYWRRLDSLGMAYEGQVVETSFGDTHVIQVGPADGPPVVVLHGLEGSAPAALEQLRPLCDHCRLYAIDIIGRPNLSAEFRPEKRGVAYGQWLHEILSRLRVKQGTLVGWSFGAFIALKSLPFAGDRVGRVVLINPAGIVRGTAWRTWWQVLRPLRQFQRRRKQGALDRLQYALQTEQQPANASCWPLFLLRYGLDLSPVPLLTAEQANRIRTPIRIIAASRDVLYPGRAVLRRARQLWPGWDDGLLLHGERHLLSRTGQARVAAYVREVVEGRMG